MYEYKVPVDIYVSGTVTVTARDADEAQSLVQEMEERMEDHPLPVANTVLDRVDDATVTGLLALKAEAAPSGNRKYRSVKSGKTKVRVAADTDSTKGGIVVRSRKLRDRSRNTRKEMT